MERSCIVPEKNLDDLIDRVVAADLLDQTPLVRAARVDRFAGEDEPGRAARAHEARQQRRLDHGRNAQAHLGHGEARPLGGDAQVARGRDLEAGADHRAVQTRDHGDGKLADRIAHGVDLLDEGAGVGSVQRGELLDVGAAAERLAAPAQDHDTKFRIRFHPLEIQQERIEGRRVQRIDLLGTVEEDAGHPAFGFHVDHMPSLSAASREALKRVSTATLTTVLFKRGLRNVFIQGVFPLNRSAPRMVGEAYTLRYIPAREDLDLLGAFEGRGHPQREAIEACPPGQVLVMDARRDASAATGGDILMTRLMVRGVAGVVTDGGLRDSQTIEKLPWPAYCGARSAPLNLVRHHAVDSQVPIGCGGVAVYPGDVVVGDEEGVVVIPSKMAEEVAAEAAAQNEFEEWVEARVKEGRSIFGLYPPSAETKAEFEAWKKKR